MSARPEQIDNGEWNRYYKKFLKRIAKRRRRRIEKAMLDDAPKKDEYKGYSL